MVLLGCLQKHLPFSATTSNATDKNVLPFVNRAWFTRAPTIACDNLKRLALYVCNIVRFDCKSWGL